MMTAPGSIGWFDLTVPDADRLRDFYAAVVGWTPEPVAMGGYSDYGMNTPDGKTIAGVCHARGSNQGLPSCWMIYITVADLDAALAAALARGGKQIGDIRGPKGAPRFVCVTDPAGASFMLYEGPSSGG